MNENPERIKCITFDKEAQNALPQHIKDRMKANQQKAKRAYQWQGEPCDVNFGYVTQIANDEKPLYWYNYECHNNTIDPTETVKRCLIPAVQVTQHGQTFNMANHFGIAVHKLINGGWPNYSHFSLDGEFTEYDKPEFAPKSFDLSGYEEHENARNKWFANEYPQDYEKLQRLKSAFHNSIK